MTESLTNCLITTGSHILKASPFFAGVYTVYNDTSREVDIEGTRISLRKNFWPIATSSPFPITILFDELFYNKQGTPPLLSRPNINSFHCSVDQSLLDSHLSCDCASFDVI